VQNINAVSTAPIPKVSLKKHIVQDARKRSDMFETHIHNWIQNFLSIPHATFNNLPPCPFAKQALLDNKIQCVEIKPYEHISMHDYFIAELENFSYHWPKGKEVVVIGCEPCYISAVELSLATETANNKFLYNRGYVALEDHPDEKEQVQDVVLNNGLYAIIFLQQKEKLNTARTSLLKQSYYKNWDTEYYNEVTER